MNEQADGVWRPENDMGAWVPTRYVLEAGRRRQYEDGRWHGPTFYRNTYDNHDLCQTRCDLLNSAP